MKAHEVMSTPVVTVRPDTPIDDAAQLMTGHRVNTLPVTDEHDQLLGVLTESDLFRALAVRLGIGLSPTAHLDENRVPRRVADVAHADTQHLDHDAELWHCLTAMANHGSHSLPVLREGRVVGIIGRREAINALAVVDPDRVRRRVAQGQVPPRDTRGVPA